MRIYMQSTDWGGGWKEMQIQNQIKPYAVKCPLTLYPVLSCWRSGALPLIRHFDRHND